MRKEYLQTSIMLAVQSDSQLLLHIFYTPKGRRLYESFGIAPMLSHRSLRKKYINFFKYLIWRNSNYESERNVIFIGPVINSGKSTSNARRPYCVNFLINTLCGRHESVSSLRIYGLNSRTKWIDFKHSMKIKTLNWNPWRRIEKLLKS